jgi:hydroxymethylbilane synthase
MTELRIGTRGSALALAQTHVIASALGATEVIVFSTEGDSSPESLSSLGGTGVFASALREALLADKCNIVVHSLKDLPTTPHPELVIAAIPQRADARDVLCSRDGFTLDTLPTGATIGTGSPRRAAQLRNRRSDLTVTDMRGNVDTRLAHVTGGDCDAIVLAAAGLDRLGRTDAVSEYLDLDTWPTAPGQGALAIEVRAGHNNLINALVNPLDHASTRITVEAEREVLAVLEAGCSAPIGAHAFIDEGLLFLSARVYSADGTAMLTGSHALAMSSTDHPAAAVAHHVARQLLDAGAQKLTGGLG